MRIEVIRAWPRRHESVLLDLPEGATVREALSASRLELEGISGQALFGQRVDADAQLRDGDRVELLRPLLADPKDARRRRAGKTKSG